MNAKIPHNKGMRTAPRLDLTCGACGKQYQRYASYYKTAKGFPKNTFCSRACSGEFYRQDKSPHWTGGRYVESRAGYVVVYVPSEKVKDRKKYEHTVVAEKALGRPLKKDEVVHHIDGNTGNNKPSNLLICSNSYHRWGFAQ